ncbi:MAG TPA: BON domain-containing protein [Candidatus Limnocylindria bacterium]|jgi:hyperosmotically inducible protein|nr:BON domain-containing protein [Candidatus Limnocylindria bacterium]
MGVVDLGEAIRPVGTEARYCLGIPRQGGAVGVRHPPTVDSSPKHYSEFAFFSIDQGPGLAFSPVNPAKVATPKRCTRTFKPGFLEYQGLASTTASGAKRHNPRSTCPMKIWNSCTLLGVLSSLSLAVATATLSGCAGDQYNRSTGEYIDDKLLGSHVKSALSDNPDYKFDDVNVTAFRGTVQLSGFVNTEELRKKAGDVAEKVTGVKEVKNNITVKGK